LPALLNSADPLYYRLLPAFKFVLVFIGSSTRCLRSTPEPLR